MRRKLTKAFVDTLQPRGDRPRFVFDSEVRGLAVKALAGGGCTWSFSYRLGLKPYRVKLGDVGPALPLEAARRLASEARVAVGRGEHPVQVAQRAARTAPAVPSSETVDGLCALFDAEHVGPHCRPSTQRMYRSAMAEWIRPRLGHLDVAAVTAQDVRRVHLAIKRTPTPAAEGVPAVTDRRYTANRTLSTLSRLFVFAVERGLRPDNPARDVKRFKEQRHELPLAVDTGLLGRLGAAVDALQARGDLDAHTAGALFLLLGCGVRKSEGLRLRHEDVDLTAGLARLPETKAGQPRTLALPLAVRARLAKVPRVVGSPWLFPSPADRTQPLADVKRPWRKVCEEAAVPALRLHDARHVYVSAAIAAGASPEEVARRIGHSEASKVWRNYAHAVKDSSSSVFDALTSGLAPKARRRGRR